MKITTQNSFFLALGLLFANLSTSSCKSSCLAASFSMLMSAKLSRRSCAIDERKYDFISFSYETVTGSVQNRIKIVLGLSGYFRTLVWVLGYVYAVSTQSTSTGVETEYE